MNPKVFSVTSIEATYLVAAGMVGAHVKFPTPWRVIAHPYRNQYQILPMFDFHAPDWLYEALPYVYVIAGIATIANLGSTLSMLSGGLLISAGLYTRWMRRTHRNKEKRRENDRRASDRRQNLRAEMDRIVLQRRQAERRDAERRRT
jgi:hypothetical protein